jgi:AbrB family looped-hinge helix DNA binding protein
MNAGGNIPPAFTERPVMAASVKVDSKSRLVIPRQLREALGIHPGDTMFVDAAGSVLQYVKSENPFDVLIDHAKAEHAAGRTKSLRNFAVENHIDLE